MEQSPVITIDHNIQNTRSIYRWDELNIDDDDDHDGDYDDYDDHDGDYDDHDDHGGDYDDHDDYDDDYDDHDDHDGDYDDDTYILQCDIQN